jgi:hypothetical protein
MPVPQWKETGGYWEDDHTWLTDEELAKCARAYDAEEREFRSPIPTRNVSNGEYLPKPQSKHQKQVEARIQELTEESSRKLGMSRRKFLASTGGMAAALLAMNDVYGRFFNVAKAELFETEAFAANSLPDDLFIVDDQLHFVRGTNIGAQALRAIAQGPTSAPTYTSNPFNPATLVLRTRSSTPTPGTPSSRPRPASPLTRATSAQCLPCSMGFPTSLGSPGERNPVYPAVTFPAPLGGPPTVCGGSADRIDVFARGIDGDALHRVWDGEYWSEFRSLGRPGREGSKGNSVPFTGALTACSWGPERIDVFGRALDGWLYHASLRR